MTTNPRRNRPRPLETDVGFRLLDSANNNNNNSNSHNHNSYYLSVVNYEPPEPPRAPEPYKLGPSSTSRAHRKSSFVILAEAERETSGTSPDDSPTHGIRSSRSRSPLSPSRINRNGRASPFRPRGFKGPPPHAQSRPASPPPPENNNRRRFVRQKSLSQGNSPRKQSLIPQPRGGLTKAKNPSKPERERWKGSSKFPNLPRTSSLKTPQPVRRPLIEAAKGGKSAKTVTTRLPKQIKSPIKSPTKIPIRNGGNGGRFVKVSNAKKTPAKPEVPPQEVVKAPVLPVNPPSDSSPLVTDESVIMGGVGGGGSGSTDDSLRRPRDDDEDLGLIDLLKQSSGASATSSVVGATTTTAVQPLKIDAAAILPPAEALPERKEVKKEAPNAQTLQNPTEKKEVTADVEVSQGQKGSVTPKDSKMAESKASMVVPKDTAKVAANQIEIGEEAKNVNNAKNSPNSNSNIAKLSPQNSKNPLEVETLQKKPDSNGAKDTVKNSAGEIGGNSSKPASNRTSPRSLTKASIEELPTTTTKEKLRNHGSEASLKSSKSNGLSTGSVESIRSTDTGVSLNTVRGVSSAREKRGTVKRPDEIETLSGNVMHYEQGRRPENGEPAIVETANPTVTHGQGQENLTRLQRFKRWKNSVIERLRERWRRRRNNSGGSSSTMTCLGCRRGGGAGGSKPKQQRVQTSTGRRTRDQQGGTSRCARFRAAFCRGFRWGSKVAPSESTSCCRPEGTCGFFCCRNWCRLPSCACCQRWCSCCRRSSDGGGGEGRDQRSKSIRAKHSLTSVAPPPLSEAQKSKIPDVLVEHNSVMRGAIPCLPVPLAWFCLVWNVLLPGTGTVWSGLFNLCTGQPRFSQTTSPKGRFGALIVNILVGVSQAFTVLFCLVGWGWSIWWAVIMIRLARKWKRYKTSEAANGDPEARGPEGVLPAPGVPTQALRAVERAR